MLELEAKNTWCPMTGKNGRQIYDLYLEDTDSNNAVTMCACITDSCILWYWDDSNRTKGHCALANVDNS